MRLVIRIVVAVLAIALLGGGAAFALGAARATPGARRPNTGAGMRPGNELRGLVSTRTVDGLRITLRIPARSEPSDALIKTGVTVTNVSTEPVDLIGSGCLRQPSVQMLDGQGRPYPPPAFTEVSECAYEAPHPLAPGVSIASSPLVMLQSGRLRPEITIFVHGSSQEVTGSIVPIHLTHAQAPRVILRSGSNLRSTGGYTATVVSAWKHSGPLYVESFQSCRQSNGGGSQTGSSYWGPVHGSTIRTSILVPSCHSQLWHFYAGWLGHPVVELRLAKPKGSQLGY